MRLEVRKNGSGVTINPFLLTITSSPQGPIYALESTSFSGILGELSARTNGATPARSVIFHLYTVIDDRLPLNAPRHPFHAKVIAIPVDDAPL